MYVAAVVTLGLILLGLTMSVGFAVFTPPSVFAGFVILGSIALGYVLDGAVLGVLVPSSRWLPQIIGGAGIAAGNEYFWPFSSTLVLNLVSGSATFLWTLALMHAGSFLGNRVGARLGYQPLPKATWVEYLSALLLLIGATALKAIIDKGVSQ